MKRTFAFFALLFAWVMGFAQQRTDSVHVAHYDLHLSVVDFTNHLVDGYTDITVVSKVNNLNQLRLDLMFLTADSILVDGAAAAFTHVGQSVKVTVPTMQLGDSNRFRRQLRRLLL